MPTPPLLTRLTPLLFVLLWSTGFIGAKFGLPYAEPLTFLSSRYVLVIALMSLLALAMRAPWPASPREALHIGVTGVLVQALYLGGVFMSIHRGLPAGISALVVGMQPLLTAALAGALLGERVSARQWAGLALGFGGATDLVSGSASQLTSAVGGGISDIVDSVSGAVSSAELVFYAIVVVWGTRCAAQSVVEEIASKT
mgnify:CR=1 FL=1